MGGSGSGQQLVTTLEDRSSKDTFWLVRESNNEKSCAPGTPIRCGETIRLTHMSSGKNLHSHDHRSPLSNQKEVSGFGENGQGDTADDWTVECKKGKKNLMRNEGFFLKHRETGHYLGSTTQAKFTHQNCGGRCPILNHLEVFGRGRADTMCE